MISVALSLHHYDIGLCGAPPNFIQLIQHVLQSFLKIVCPWYIWTLSWCVAQPLRWHSNQLTLSWKGKPRLHWSYTQTHAGLCRMRSDVRDIVSVYWEWTLRKSLLLCNVRQVQAFLGLASYYENSGFCDNTFPFSQLIEFFNKTKKTATFDATGLRNWN